MRVKKYNKKYQDFDKTKIETSIKLAADAVKEDIPEFMVKRLAQYIEDDLTKADIKTITAEDISTRVENKLMQSSYKNTAWSYITYHYDRQKEHVYNSDLIKAFEKKLSGTNIENSNANCDERSFSGRMNEAAKVLLKDNALKTMSKTFRDNHNNNEVYTHDLDSYSSGQHNCLSIPFDPMFKNGVHIKQTDIRPPKSISTAMQQLAVYIQVQSLQQFGGVSATHLDWTMIPSIRWSFFKHLRDGYKYLKNMKFEIPENCETISIDNYKEDPCYQYALDMTVRETLQGAEALIHNLNSLQSRSGQQLPFSSINYGTCTLTEGRILINAILDATIAGTGPLHKTPIFPCGIFQWDKDLNGYPGTPNYDLFRKALYCTSRRFYPNYCNCNWSVNLDGIKKDIEHKKECLSKLDNDQMKLLAKWVKNNVEEAKKYKMVLNKNKVEIDPTLINPVEITSTMGCRTFNAYDSNFDFNVVLNSIFKIGEAPNNYFYSGNQKDGRGNIAPATIILPTIAMQSRGKLGRKNIEDFISRLSIKIDDCRDSLIERFTLIASQSPASAIFMYYNNTMLGYVPKEGIVSALKHGSLAIGQLGLAECLQILIGTDHTTPEGMELAKRIESLFNTKCAEYKSKTYTILDQEMHLNFGVYYTPAESLCHTALNKFKDKYGVIPNVSDKKFFTNSIHIPVWYDITPFEKIDLESQLTGYSNAGCITYVEIDTAANHNIDAMETLVVYAMEHDVPYLGLNLSLDTCRACGWTGEIGEECPACKSKNIQRLRRVTGYITESYTSTFNIGKVDEVEHRVKHHGTVNAVDLANICKGC